MNQPVRLQLLDRRPMSGVVVVLVAMLALAASPARLHLRLTKSEPAADAIVSKPPLEIRLWFSEPPEVSISKVDLLGPDGAVKLSKIEPVHDEAAMRVGVAATLVPGSYTVKWRTASGDGHPVRGEFSFRVIAPHSRR